MTTFWNPLAGTSRGPPLVRGPQFENRWSSLFLVHNFIDSHNQFQHDREQKKSK